jgi:hypothetical protein
LASSTGQPVGAAPPSCPYGPNIYAGGIDGQGSQYGIEGSIRSFQITAPTSGMNFTDEAIHAYPSSVKGLEVGWYEGWGPQTGTYVTSPHAYATLNGPGEVDGPLVGAALDFYTTWWSGDNQEWYVQSSPGGSTIWNGSQVTNTSGPGPINGVGEVSAYGISMAGSYQGLEIYDSQGQWKSWSGTSLCADSPYNASGDTTSFSVLGG